LRIIAKMDTNSIEYRTAVFEHAIKNGYFTLKNPDSLAKSIYSTYKTEPLIKSYEKNGQAVQTFWRHEIMKNIDVLPVLKTLKNTGMPIYALYGKQDGLYSIAQVEQLAQVIGMSKLKYLDNCSHTLFVDQQSKFIESLKDWLN
jgi:proline iminopeptidase